MHIYIYISIQHVPLSVYIFMHRIAYTDSRTDGWTHKQKDLYHLVTISALRLEMPRSWALRTTRTILVKLHGTVPSLLKYYVAEAGASRGQYSLPECGQVELTVASALEGQ